MLAVVSRRLSAPPANLDEFIDGIAAGVCEIYGEEAALAYRARAPRGFGAALAAPMAALWGVEVTRGCAALLMGILRGETAEITLIHVLPEFAGQGMEHALVATATHAFQAAGARAVLSESTQHVPMELDGAFGAAGFSSVPRGLYRVSTAELSQATLGARNDSVPLGPAHFSGVAACIAEAYAGHPGRLIHPEVRTPVAAQDYLLRVLTGAHGPVLPNHCRVVLDGGEVIGVLLGCEVAPQTGFVLQLAVRPAARGAGIGTALLHAFAHACETAEVPAVALGVTLDNPARNLYEKLGFRMQRPVTAYHLQLDHDSVLR
jgi:ribosomal protein S18 acetylase RimI-like enzyme